jgi:hypothetical protein
MAGETVPLLTKLSSRRTDTVYSVVEICCYLTHGPMQLCVDPLSLLKSVHPPREVLVKPHSIVSRIRNKTLGCSNDRVGLVTIGSVTVILSYHTQEKFRLFPSSGREIYVKCK